MSLRLCVNFFHVVLEVTFDMRRSSDMTTLAEWGELRFLRWVRKQFGHSSLQIPISIGDDAAQLKFKNGNDGLVTTDALIEGTHFNFHWTTAAQLGHKAMAVNLSDLAAMGAKPIAAFLSLGVPPETRIAHLQNFFRAFAGLGKTFGCALAGGDFVRAPIWMINVALIGEPANRGRISKRSSAQRGQAVYVTGTLGDSAAGLESLQKGAKIPKHVIERHLRPSPRVREGAILTKVCSDLALIDVSDGLVNDAGHLSRESGVSITLELSKLPISKQARMSAKRLDINPLDWMLYGGEDYELLFATRAPLKKIEAEFRKHGLTTPVTAIGNVEAGKGVALINEFGKRLRPEDRTYKHFA